MTHDARLALRALRDCKVIRAGWGHRGYGLLRDHRLVSYRAIPGTHLVEHRLNERGEAMARSLFQ